jgi:hypothetical protein
MAAVQPGALAQGPNVTDTNKHQGQRIAWPVPIQVNTQKQDRQCTYKRNIRRFLVTIVSVEKQEELYILSVCL